MVLSASVEGKYMEQNRPFKNKSKIDLRDDAFYDKLFSYCSKNRYGFHPMIYSDNIEKWIENFLWFQEMFKKYDIPAFMLYLLEVRNAEWTIEQINEFQKFYDYIINWTFNFFKKNKEAFIDAILSKHRGFNIISSPISTIGRGLGCSIQSTLYVRLGDLKTFPCHRLFYPQFETLHFITDTEGDIQDIEVGNPELLLAIYSFQSTIAPYCSSCINKYMCSKGCLGSQFETTGDIFTPIPTVCQLEFAKSIQFINSMDKLGVLTSLKQRVAEHILQNINLIEDLYKKEKGAINNDT
jgi:radical SAM protein with 4Fe4S-binding SPASM domain